MDDREHHAVRAWLVDLIDQARRGLEPARLVAIGGVQALVIAGELRQADADAWMGELVGGEDASVTVTAQATAAGDLSAEPTARPMAPPRFAGDFRGEALREVIAVGAAVGDSVVTSVELYDDGIVVCGHSPRREPGFVDVQVGDGRFAGGVSQRIGTAQRWLFAFTPGLGAGEAAIVLSIDGALIEVPL